jgi:hypothetical protein
MAALAATAIVRRGSGNQQHQERQDDGVAA